MPGITVGILSDARFLLHQARILRLKHHLKALDKLYTIISGTSQILSSDRIEKEEHTYACIILSGTCLPQQPGKSLPNFLKVRESETLSGHFLFGSSALSSRFSFLPE